MWSGQSLVVAISVSYIVVRSVTFRGQVSHLYCDQVRHFVWSGQSPIVVRVVTYFVARSVTYCGLVSHFFGQFSNFLWSGQSFI